MSWWSHIPHSSAGRSLKAFKQGFPKSYGFFQRNADEHNEEYETRYLEEKTDSFLGMEKQLTGAIPSIWNPREQANAMEFLPFNP